MKWLYSALVVFALLSSYSEEKKEVGDDVLFIRPSWLVEQSRDGKGKVPLFANVDGVWTSCNVDLLALQRLQFQELERQSKMKPGVQVVVEEKLPFFKPARNCNLCRGSGWMMKFSVCKCIKDQERALKKRQQQSEKETKKK